MRRPLFLFLCCALFSLPLAAQHIAAPAPYSLVSVVDSARAMVLRDWAHKGYPGIAVAVSVDGRTLWSEGFGYADLEHRVPMWPTNKFRIGSISKPMAAAAIARLFAKGLVDLDAPVQRYVPLFPLKRWPLTTRQLGGHLGGVRHYRGQEMLNAESYATVERGLDIFAADTLMHEPGSRFLYSSYGWNLISAVVEGASGMPFLDFMRTEVFEPLGMIHTVADHPDSLIHQRVRFYERDASGDVLNAPFVNNSYKWAGGGFLSSPEDLLLFGNAHLEGAYLPPVALQMLFTEQHAADGHGVGYGFGWRMETGEDQRRYISHGGGSVGGTSLLIMQPDTRVVVAATINLSQADLSVIIPVVAMFVEAAAK